MNTDEIRQALRRKYPAGEYAVLEEVRNATGFGANRSADALVMSLWPSRGLELWGIEIKASRPDWLREKKNPKKAESIAAYCDRWFVAIGDASICPVDELPPAWGLLAPRGNDLVVVKQADKTEAKQADRSFLAAMFRRAQETGASAQQIRAAVQVAVRETSEREQILRKNLERDYGNLTKRVEEFELASGVRVTEKWQSPEKIGAAVRTVLDGRHLRGISELRETERRLSMVLDVVRNTVREAEGDASATIPAPDHGTPISTGG